MQKTIRESIVAVLTERGTALTRTQISDALNLYGDQLGHPLRQALKSGQIVKGRLPGDEWRYLYALSYDDIPTTLDMTGIPMVCCTVCGKSKPQTDRFFIRYLSGNYEGRFRKCRIAAQRAYEIARGLKRNRGRGRPSIEERQAGGAQQETLAPGHRRINLLDHPLKPAERAAKPNPFSGVASSFSRMES